LIDDNGYNRSTDREIRTSLGRYAEDGINDNGDNLRGNQCPCRATRKMYFNNNNNNNNNYFSTTIPLESTSSSGGENYKDNCGGEN
jgi:hypothetical protein